MKAEEAIELADHQAYGDVIVAALRAACGGGPVVILEDGTLATLRRAGGESDEDGFVVEVFTGAMFVGEDPLWLVVPVGES